jgi:hypothetical protein
VLFISTRPLHYYQLLPGCCLLIDIHYCTLRLHNPLRAVLRYKSGISRSTSATRHRHRPDRLSHSRGLSSQTLCVGGYLNDSQSWKKRRNLAIRHPPSLSIRVYFQSTIGGRRRRRPYHFGTDSRSTATSNPGRLQLTFYFLLLGQPRPPRLYHVAGVTISTYIPHTLLCSTRDDHLLTVPDTLLSHTPSYPSPNSKWSQKMSRPSTSWDS